MCALTDEHAVKIFQAKGKNGCSVFSEEVRNRRADQAFLVYNDNPVFSSWPATLGCYYTVLFGTLMSKGGLLHCYPSFQFP